MFFHSSYTNDLIKLYSIFSAINHFQIYSNLMLLQCHVRKQIKFIFISLSYKTICSNRDLFFFYLPSFLFSFQFPSPLTSFLSSLPLPFIHCGPMRSFLQNILITPPHHSLDIEQLSISRFPVSHTLMSPGDASEATGPNQNSELRLCDHSLLPSPRRTGFD